MRKLIIGLTAALAVAAFPVGGAAGVGFTDVEISGKKLVVKDNSAKGKPNSAIFKSKDPNFLAIGFDPTISGATFQLIDPFPGVTSSEFPMPAGNWTLKKGKFSYKDKDLSEGPVKSAQLKDGGVKIVLKGGDFSLAGAPLQEVGGILTFLQPALTASASRPNGLPVFVNRICFLFPGTQGEVKKDTTKLYKARNAEAPGFCPGILN
jgi:hypothetical protein